MGLSRGPTWIMNDAGGDGSGRTETVRSFAGALLSVALTRLAATAPRDSRKLVI